MGKPKRPHHREFHPTRRGDVVIIPFPFSDLSATKVRPALVVATPTTGDMILCQITSQAKSDGYSVSIRKVDMASGDLNLDSYVRPNWLFTASPSLVIGRAGKLKAGKVDEVVGKIIAMIRGQ